MAFYVSSKKEPFYYKIQRIKKGTTAKGEPYTFINISAKDKKDSDKWKEASLTIWEDVRANVGDKIAIFSISAFNYSESESGFKKYLRVEATVDRFNIKPAEQTEDKTTPKETPAQTATATATPSAPPQAQPPVQKQATSRVAEFETDDGDWGDLPF